MFGQFTINVLDSPKVFLTNRLELGYALGELLFVLRKTVFEDLFSNLFFGFEFGYVGVVKVGFTLRLRSR